MSSAIRYIVSARQFAGTSVNLAALFMNLHNILGGRGRTIRSSPFCLSSMRARLIVTYISYIRLFFHFLALRSTRMVRIGSSLTTNSRTHNGIQTRSQFSYNTLRYGWNNARGMRASEGWEGWNRESKAKELARRHYRTRVSFIYR